MVKTENIIKVGLVAVGTYLAWDYWKKKKANKVSEKELMASTVSPTLIDAEMQEEGEEGMAVAMANDSEIAKMSSFNGWDSDVLTSGV